MKIENFRAVIFDVDGVFFDTETLVFDVFRRLFDPDSVFDVIVTGDEVTHKKPHPEPYLTVAQKLDEAPEDCLVLEDSLAGIRSAKSAGCFCVGLRQPCNRHADFGEADLVIDRLDRLVVP